MILVAVTGASGAVIGVRLVEALLSLQRETAVIVSEMGWQTLNYELFNGEAAADSFKDVLVRRGRIASTEGLVEYRADDLFAPPASGTFPMEACVISPASMKTVAAIAAGYSDSLITRAADVALKEARPLILVPRETPLSLIHLDNMLKLKKAGAHIVPPVPGFYRFPRTIDDVVDFIAGKVLNLLGVENDLAGRWGLEDT